MAVVNGTPDHDTLYGADDNDTVNGGEGNDIQYGRGGNDTLNGEGGNDTLYGEDADDTLDGGTGDDVMDGGIGNDIYYVDSVGDSVVETLNMGIDEVRTSLASYSLWNTHLENLRATSDIAHNFQGSQNNNILIGGAGGDYLDLASGGIDTAIGGAGNDAIYFGGNLRPGAVVDGGDGRDQLGIRGHYGLSPSSPYTLSPSFFVNIEMLVLISGADLRFSSNRTSFSYHLRMVDASVPAGQQLTVSYNLLGSQSSESLSFDGSAETDGSFLTYAGFGVDILIGGQQGDAFYFGADGRFNSLDRVDGQGGIDQLGLQGDYSGPRWLSFGANTVANIEMIVLLSAGDNRFGGGSADGYSYELVMHDGNVANGARMIISANTLRADGTLNETLVFNGFAEKDGSFTIYAGNGADVLVGGDRSDEIWGRGGNDLITGRLGADVLRGGDGNDMFDYNALAESTAAFRDSILDFTSGSDKINLADIDANTLLAGDQAFTWIGSNAFTGNGSAGELRAYYDGATWIVEGDVNGDGFADFQIGVVLATSDPLVASDFLL